MLWYPKRREAGVVEVWSAVKWLYLPRVWARAMLSGRLFESVPPIQGEAILIAEDGSGRAEEGTGLGGIFASVLGEI
jgi:hypothetical protein